MSLEGTDISALFTGLIAAGSALAGVLLTERAQSRIAREGRVWTEQSHVYVALISWGRLVEYHLRTSRENGHSPVWSELAVLDDEVWDQAWAYASPEILVSANNLRLLQASAASAQDGVAEAIEQAARQLRIEARTVLQGARQPKRRLLR